MYLDDKIGNDPPILGMHPGPVSVEDPCDPDLDPGPLVVGVGQGLRHPLALVVAGPGADRVDIPPVGLGLGMNIRVTIHLESQLTVDDHYHSHGTMRCITSLVEAMRILALVLLARPSMLRVPTVLVLMVLTGLYM